MLDDGTSTCTHRPADGGCGWYERRDEGKYAMKVRRLVETEVEVKAIRLRVPNRYHDEEGDQFGWYPEGAGYDREKHELTLVLDLDERRVRDWPAGVTAEVHLKVVDEGSYELLDADGKVCAQLVEQPIPPCLPGEYGDYLILVVNPEGRVGGWNPDPEDVVESFGLRKAADKHRR